MVYGEAYGRGMWVSGRQRREGRSFSASVLFLPTLPPADWHPSPVSIAVYTTKFSCGGVNSALRMGEKFAILVVALYSFWTTPIVTLDLHVSVKWCVYYCIVGNMNKNSLRLYLAGIYSPKLMIARRLRDLPVMKWSFKIPSHIKLVDALKH